jgi:amino acid transporter
MFLNLGMGALGLILFTPDVAFFFFVGLVLVLGVTVAYLLANLGVFLFYRRERPDEFNWILHFVFPLFSSAVLIYAIWQSFPQPEPYIWAPVLDGVWLLIGIGILVFLYLRGNEEWLNKAGKSIGESV